MTRTIDPEQLADGVLASIWEHPEFRAARPAREDLRAFVRWNVDLAQAWIVEGSEPSDEELEPLRELARALAQAGAPIDAVPGNYRRGARYAWRTAVDAAGEDEGPALLARAERILDYVDRMSSVFTHAYEEAARTTRAAELEQAAQELFERVSAGNELRLRDRELCESIGVDPAALAHAFVMAVPGRSIQEHVSLARRLRSDGALAVARGPRVAGLAPDGRLWRRHVTLADAIVADAPLDPERTPGALIEELLAVAELAARRGCRGEVRADEFLVMLALRGAPVVAARIRSRVYDGLSEELAQTLDVLIRNGFDRGATAAALPVHRNTLRNRLHRIRDLTGVDVTELEGQTLATLAWLQR
jgi:hypothetical protein